MGQKVNPIGLRTGVFRGWASTWYADKKQYADFLIEDLHIRDFVKRTLFFAGVSAIEIARAFNKITVTIHTARPGIVIGRGGKEIDKLETDIAAMTRSGGEIKIEIREIRNPDVQAVLVAETIAQQIEKRISYRKAMKRAVTQTMSAGAKGVRIQLSGRLGGAEIARREGYKEGKIPLHTLKADIDYALAEAITTYGKIGVKVWIFRGDYEPAQ